MKPDLLNQNYNFSDASGVGMSESQVTENESKGKEEGCLTSINKSANRNNEEKL